MFCFHMPCWPCPRLQGENVPGNVAQLQELVLSYGTEGEEVPARVPPFSGCPVLE